MESFATIEQYEARYGECEDPELLTEILSDATRMISSELNRAGIPLTEDTADLRMQVCRAVAYRTMDEEIEGAAIPFGATQFSQGAGAYTESFSIGNPYRDMYLTKAERRMLGIGRSRVHFVMPGGEDACAD